MDGNRFQISGKSFETDSTMDNYTKRGSQLKQDFHSRISFVADEFFALEKCSDIVVAPQNPSTTICLDLGDLANVI